MGRQAIIPRPASFKTAQEKLAALILAQKAAAPQRQPKTPLTIPASHQPELGATPPPTPRLNTPAPLATPSVKTAAPNPTAAAKPKKKAEKPTAQSIAAKTMKALAIEDPAHALLCVPTSYLDCRRPRTSIANMQDGEAALCLLQKTGIIIGLDARNQEVDPAPYSSLYEAPWQSHWCRIVQIRTQLVDSEHNIVWLSTFGGAWATRKSHPTEFVLAHATYRVFGRQTFLTSPTFIPAEAQGVVYPSFTTPGAATSDAGVRMLIAQALAIPDAVEKCIRELIEKTKFSEAQILALANLCAAEMPAQDEFGEPVENANPISFTSLQRLITTLHKPTTMEEALSAQACMRLIAIRGICHSARLMNERPQHPKSRLKISSEALKRVIGSQTETLTKDQTDVVAAICERLKGPFPLNALLGGDVGSGKTLTFAIPCVTAHLGSANVAIIAPTEILANQLFNNFRKRFPFARVERVVTGKKIADTSAILIGTGGLTTAAKKQGYQADLIVIDEQHKLATEVRTALCHPWTHTIEASATPIPRSLASSLFAGMTSFTLHQTPFKRNINSVLLDEKQRPALIREMRETIAQNGLVAFIYPRVNQSANAAASVINAAAMLEERFPGKVGVLHGKLSAEETEQTLENFRSRKKPILVATTVMETGIDVPDIRMMIVRDADYFGISQLHQLRGRLARNGGSATFALLVSDIEKLADDTLQRLKAVTTISDGFKLAEADMRQRGIGDITGEAQSGNILTPVRLLGLTLEDFESVDC